MKKIWIVGFVFLTVLFGAGTRISPANAPSSTVNTAADMNVAPDPLIQQMATARANGDRATYERLIKEWQKQNQPYQNSKFPILQSLSANNDHPTMSWADDKTVFAGNVNYNTWAAGAGLDDEAIDVDYVNGDTLRAVIAAADSSVYIYQSVNKGQTWAWWGHIVGFGGLVYEPQIINQNAGWCHFFARTGANNGNLIAMNFDPAHAFTYTYLDASADTIADYSVTSDRVQWGSDCWLFVAYHKQLGGAGLDGIWFTSSVDHGQTWAAAYQLQFAGSGYPDLSYGANNYLWESYIFNNGSAINIASRRSTDEGGTWQGSVTVMTDASAKTTPKIAGSHSTQNNAWIVWGRKYTGTPYDWDVLASWTKDAGATWSAWVYNPGWINMQDVMPSISIFDNSGTYDVPYLSYLLTADTLWNTPAVRTKYWHTSDSTWGPNSDEAVYNDNAPALTGPVQCWENPGYPALAYVGTGGVNVYYDSWSNTGVEEGKNPVVTGKLLSPNQPNPFRVSTRFQYTVPEPGRISIGVYNTIGQKVASLIDEYKAAGTYQASYNGSALPRGIYFLKYHCGKANLTRKLIVE